MVVGALALLVFPNAASAATADGRYYPCNQDFANRVAIASGFDKRAAKVNSNYRDPRFWEAHSPLCADFDSDGSDEMAFPLGAMGGTDPWAIYEVPAGDPSQATYLFPTLAQKGRYPNRGLSLIHLDGVPAIREKRRLFRPKDPHCCPGGGTRFRIIGFEEGRFRVLETYARRPDVPDLTRWQDCGSRKGQFPVHGFSPLTGAVHVTALRVRCGKALHIGHRLFFGQECVYCDDPSNYSYGDRFRFKGFRCIVYRGDPQRFHCVRGKRVINVRSSIDQI